MKPLFRLFCLSLLLLGTVAMEAAAVRSERLIRKFAVEGSDPRSVGADAASFEARRNQTSWAR